MIDFAHAQKYLPTRIAEKITVLDNGCWKWEGATQSNGYGRAWDGDRSVYAHRFVYETLFFEIREDLIPECRFKLCANPEHMKPQTRSQTLKGRCGGVAQRRVTHCPQGHPYDVENTSHRKGRRHCKACNRIRYHRSKQ